MEMKTIREGKKREKQDYKRLSLREKGESNVKNLKKTNKRKIVHLSVLDKVKGLTNKESLEVDEQVEIALRLWSKGSISEKGGNGRSIQIVNKGKRKRDRGVDFIKVYSKEIKENTGSYTRIGWKDIKGIKIVNQVLNKRGDKENWKRRGRGRHEKSSGKEQRRWLDMDRMNHYQMEEMRNGRNLISNTKEDGNRITILKEMYRIVIMKSVLIQIWSRMIRRGKIIEKEKMSKGNVVHE